MTTDALGVRPRHARLRYLREHGTALVVFAGGVLWLLPVAFKGAAHGELISWTSLAVAVAGGIALGWRRLEGWRVWAASCALALLASMLAVLVAETSSVLAPHGVAPNSYREARGTGVCRSSSCGGHEAGWSWAEEQGITDPDECGGRSLSFEDGCRAYADEVSAAP